MTPCLLEHRIRKLSGVFRLVPKGSHCHRRQQMLEARLERILAAS